MEFRQVAPTTPQSSVATRVQLRSVAEVNRWDSKQLSEYLSRTTTATTSVKFILQFNVTGEVFLLMNGDDLRELSHGQPEVLSILQRLQAGDMVSPRPTISPRLPEIVLPGPTLEVSLSGGDHETEIKSTQQDCQDTDPAPETSNAEKTVISPPSSTLHSDTGHEDQLEDISKQHSGSNVVTDVITDESARTHSEDDSYLMREAHDTEDPAANTFNDNDAHLISLSTSPSSQDLRYTIGVHSANDEISTTRSASPSLNVANANSVTDPNTNTHGQLPGINAEPCTDAPGMSGGARALISGLFMPGGYDETRSTVLSPLSPIVDIYHNKSDEETRTRILVDNRFPLHRGDEVHEDSGYYETLNLAEQPSRDYADRGVQTDDEVLFMSEDEISCCIARLKERASFVRSTTQAMSNLDDRRRRPTSFIRTLMTPFMSRRSELPSSPQTLTPNRAALTESPGTPFFESRFL